MAFTRPRLRRFHSALLVVGILLAHNVAIAEINATVDSYSSIGDRTATVGFDDDDEERIVVTGSRVRREGLGLDGPILLSFEDESSIVSPAESSDTVRIHFENGGAEPERLQFEWSSRVSVTGLLAFGSNEIQSQCYSDFGCSYREGLLFTGNASNLSALQETYNTEAANNGFGNPPANESVVHSDDTDFNIRAFTGTTGIGNYFGDTLGAIYTADLSGGGRNHIYPESLPSGGVFNRGFQQFVYRNPNYARADSRRTMAAGKHSCNDVQKTGQPLTG